MEYTEPWPGSYGPSDLLSAYNLTGLPAPSTTQTIALVDAYNDPTIEHDLEVFDAQYKLPTCTTANGCFTKVEMHPSGKTPPNNAGWAQEISTDVELAHGMCPDCKVMLVEAYSSENKELEAAEAEAERLGATEISNSWGGSEEGETVAEDEASPFDHPGTVITAAAGDEGYLNWEAGKSEQGYPDYPASSPHVIAVGGTRLGIDESTGAWSEETVWNDTYGGTGGGCSSVFTAPAWQQAVADWSSVGCETGSASKRAVADVSADADPYTGVAVYDSTWVREDGVEYRGWVPIGGTSVASPTIAATFALAGGAGTDAHGKAVEYPAQTLYENFRADPGALHDVTSGSNGVCETFNEETALPECTLAEQGASCGETAVCVARTGYDGPTGVGTPDGILAFASPGEAEHAKQVTEEKQATERKAAEEKQAMERKAKEEQEQAAAEKKSDEEREAEEKTRQVKAAETLKASEEQKAAAEKKAAEELKAAAEQLAAELSVESKGATSASATTGKSPSTHSTAPPRLPVVSGLVLTHSSSVALAALSHGSVVASHIAFTFTLNVPARVRATLARATTTHGHLKWTTLGSALTITAAGGRNTARLRARGRLAPGLYRLTVTPAGGKPRTLTFRVG